MAEGRAIFSRVGGLVVTAALESGWAADRGCAGLVRLGAGVGAEWEVGRLGLQVGRWGHGRRPRLFSRVGALVATAAPESGADGHRWRVGSGVGAEVAARFFRGWGLGWEQRRRNRDAGSGSGMGLLGAAGVGGE